MIVVLIALSLGAAALTTGTGLFAFAVVNAVGALWSNGVLANFRTDPQRAPNWAASVSMLTAALAIALGIAGLVAR